MLFRLLSFFVLLPFCTSAQESSIKDSYIFHWGSLSDSIVQNDQGYNSVIISTDFETLNKTIDHPIFLTKNGKRIEIESFSFIAYSQRLDNLSQLINIEKYHPRKAAQFHGHKEIGHLLTSSTQMHFPTIKAKDGFIFYASIQLEKVISGYVSNIKLPEIPKGEVFNFQVVSFDDEKTILRVDTTIEATQHITKIYANPEKYQIIHIPNFKTTRRYISEVDLLDLGTKAISLIENEQLANLAFTDVPEFTDYSIEKIPFILQWGELKNITYEIFKETQVRTTEHQFTPDDIKDNSEQPLFLNQGYQDFEILKMRVSIVPESGIPISFITDHLNYPPIQEAMANVTSSTTIVFDELFIKTKDEKTTFLPQGFKFIVE